MKLMTLTALTLGTVLLHSQATQAQTCPDLTSDHANQLLTNKNLRIGNQYWTLYGSSNKICERCYPHKCCGPDQMTVGSGSWETTTSACSYPVTAAGKPDTLKIKLQ